MNKYVYSWYDHFKQHDKLMILLEEILFNLDVLYENRFTIPYKEDVFKAFKLCDFNTTKVIMLGKEPDCIIYNNNMNSNGLSYVTKKNTEIMKDLVQQIPTSYYQNQKGILGESNIVNSIETKTLYKSLYNWPSEGVLMLNNILTVGLNTPNSDAGLWNKFMNEFLNSIKDLNFVWIAFDDYSKKTITELNVKYKILVDKISGSNYLKKVNNLLISLNKNKIEWDKNIE